MILTKKRREVNSGDNARRGVVGDDVSEERAAGTYESGRLGAAGSNKG